MPILITTTIELVTMLFAAFGGFLGNMLPDVIEEGRFVSGFAAFVAVLIFLSIKILSRFLKRDNSRFVVFATLFFASATMFVWLGLEYRSELDRRLVRYPPHELSSPVYLSGATLADGVSNAIKRKPELKDNPLLLLQHYQGKPELVWSPESVAESRAELIQRYLFVIASLVVALGAAIETLTLAITQNKRSKSHNLKFLVP